MTLRLLPEPDRRPTCDHCGEPMEPVSPHSNQIPPPCESCGTPRGALSAASLSRAADKWRRDYQRPTKVVKCETCDGKGWAPGGGTLSLSDLQGGPPRPEAPCVACAGRGGRVVMLTVWEVGE